MAAHDEFDKNKPLEKPSVDFDQLQDELDSLLSDNELIDLPLQDTTEFLTTADMRAFDLPSDEPADAFEIPDMASTDAVDDSMPTDQEVDDALSRLDGKSESTAPEILADSADPEASHKIFLQESDLSDTDLTKASPDKNEADWQPVPDKHASDLDGIDPFSDDIDDIAVENKVPVHPDMAEENVMQRRGGGGRFMMFASIIVLTVAGGIYWLASGTQKQSEQLASSQEQTISKAVDKQPGLSDSSAVNPVETPQTPEQVQTEEATLQTRSSQQGAEKTVAAPQAETKKAAMQRAAVEKAKAKRLAEKRALAEKAKAKRLAAKQAAEKRAVAEKAKAKRLAAKQAAEKRALAEKAKAKRLALIQPSTPLQKAPAKSQPVSTSVVDEPGDWIIELASVNSAKSARQHVARIRAMGVESKAVQINNKGRIFHRIRIAGFTSKLAAMKRRDALVRKLGVLGAKVEKL